MKQEERDRLTVLEQIVKSIDDKLDKLADSLEKLEERFVTKQELESHKQLHELKLSQIKNELKETQNRRIRNLGYAITGLISIILLIIELITRSL